MFPMVESVGDRPFRWGASIAVVLAATFSFVLPLPAHAHSGHDAIPLISNGTVGPFVVSAWSVELSTPGLLDLYVVTRDEVRPRFVEVRDDTGRIADLEPMAGDTWSGTVVVAPGQETLEIRLTDDSGRSHEVVVSLSPPAIPGMSLIVLLLLAQAFITLAWLLLRWQRVWGRARQGAGGEILDNAAGSPA